MAKSHSKQRRPRPCPLPPGALLSRYQQDGNHADCFFIDIPGSISQPQFVQAFYTTPLFRLERLILKWAVSRPSSDDQVARLASGEGGDFAAWSVEDRSDNQLLMADFQGRTKSWLMTAPNDTQSAPCTRLYFGSAVLPARNHKTGEQGLGFAYRLLLGFHKLYSVALLGSAARRLIRNP